MTVYNNLHDKVTGALVAIIQAQAADLGIEEDMIRPGIYGEDLAGNCIVVTATQIEEPEGMLDGGVYRAGVTVFLHSVAPDVGHDLHNERLGILTDILRSTTIAADMTSEVNDFHCYQVVFRECENRRDENTWIFAAMLSVVFQPSDLES